MMDKSKHYYDYTRNCSCGGACLCRKITDVGIEASIGGTSLRNIFLRLQEEKEDISVPSYYIGNNGYEARKVISGFDLSYNVGTATTYLLRCGKKTEQGMSNKDKHIEDIEKAMNHLRFELERLRDEH